MVRCTSVVYVWYLLLLSNATLCGAQKSNQTRSSDGVIHVSVDRVNVAVTVTGPHGNFVKGLRREDFRIFDNGAEQPLTGFLSIEEPAQVVLLIECGPAAFFLKKSELRPADALLKSISPADRVAIVAYSTGPELVLDFTTDKTETQTALHRMNFMAGSGALNLASSVATTLEWLASEPGKKTIILLTSVVDTSPVATWQMIRQKIRASDVHILAVSMAGELREPAKKRNLSPDERDDRKFLKAGFAQADQSLRELSDATGGRVYFPKNAKGFEYSFVEIAQLVRHEYSLEFAAPLSDGQLHSLEIKVSHSWPYHIQNRQSYLAPRPHS